MDDLPLPTNKSMFDQQPIGNGMKMNIQQYPPDFNPADLQKKNQPLPIAKRLASKVWKIKKQALEQLLKIVSTQDHKSFNEHESTVIKSMADSNPQCQYISAKILFSYLQKQGSYEGESKPIVKNVIQKLMSVQRQETFNLGIQILFWILDHGQQEMIMMQLNDYLVNKNPKLVSLSMKVLQSLLNNYGIKKLNSLELFAKNFKLLAQMARPIAKPQASEMFKQVYKWVGQNSFKEFNVHPEVKDQVLKWAKTYQMQPMQIKRGLKKGQEGKKLNPMQQQQDDSSPVDVLLQYDSRWVDMVLALVKWQQKKEHLQQFIKKTKVSNIVPRQTSHYITLIKRLFSENNINLLQCGFKIVKNLCKGLKKTFAICCKSFLSYVYVKLKDNKAMIVDETLATLKAMTASITLDDMYEQIKTGLGDKSPQMRLNTLKLYKQLIGKKDPKTTKIIRSMLQLLISLTNDSSSDVRDISLSVLCKIKEYQGMMFFEDKLQGLPPKKLEQIKKTPTIVFNQPTNQNLNNEGQNDRSKNLKKAKQNNTTVKPTNLNPKVNNKPVLNQTKKPLNLSVQGMNQHNQNQTQNYNYQQNYQNPTSHYSNINMGKMSSLNNPASEPGFVKIQSGKMQEQNKKPEYMNYQSFNQQRESIIEIRNQQWPINPTPAHVLRLISLFNKLGEPFKTLATPFRLNKMHFEIIQNCQNSFIIENLDLILKWALWRVMVEDCQGRQKIVSTVVHILQLMKERLTDSQTILALSILAQTLAINQQKPQISIVANVKICDSSQSMRQKMFNFWMNTLQQASGDTLFCQKILYLLRTTYQKAQNKKIMSQQFVRMSRVDAILKNKQFMSFLLSKSSKQFLKVSGFKPQCFEGDIKLNEEQIKLLKIGGPQFYINVNIEERRYFVDIFKRTTSTDAIQQIKKLQQTLPIPQIIGLHLKILDSIVIPYMNRLLSAINVYNYFKHLIYILSMYCEGKIGNIQYVAPHYRNLLRILMFFLIDLSDSKIDNKDQLMKSINKCLIVLLDWMPADHSIQVMTMLLKYSLQNHLTKRLNGLLMKCINKTTKLASFRIKSRKNVKMIFSFFISLVQQNDVQQQQFSVKSIVSLLALLKADFKQLCYQAAKQNLNKYGQNFKNPQIQEVLVKIVRQWFSNTQNPEQQNVQTSNQIQVISNRQYQNSLNNKRLIDLTNENNKSMSNLPQNFVNRPFKNDQIPSKEFLNPNNTFNRQQFISNSAGKIRQATNTHNRQLDKLPSSTSIEQMKNENTKFSRPQVLMEPILSQTMKNQRNKLQSMQALNQSLQQLMRLRNNTLSNNLSSNPNSQEVRKDTKPTQVTETKDVII